MSHNLVTRSFPAALVIGLTVLITSCQKSEPKTSLSQSLVNSKSLGLGLTSSNSKFSNSPLLKSNNPLLSPKTAKQSCGDTSTGSETAWYPVFIDHGDLASIHSELCIDAIETTRKDTGILAVQVASFSDRDRAVAFANKIGGDVGEPTFVNGESQSNSSISSGGGEVSTPVEPELPSNNNVATAQSETPCTQYLPNVLNGDSGTYQNCASEWIKQQGQEARRRYQESLRQAQESAQATSPNERIGNQGSSTEGYNSSTSSLQTQINVDNFLNNQRRSIDNQNFLIQQRNAAGCATTTSLVC